MPTGFKMPTSSRIQQWISALMPGVLLVLSVMIMDVARLEAQAVNATILGTVTDQSHAVLPGATIEVKNVGTGVVQTTVSNAQGRYSVPALVIGDYEVQATLQGFQTAIRKGITLRVGSENVVDFILPVGQISETVTVTGAVSLVETTSAAVSSVIEEAQIRELPLNGRNVTQLVVLAPGVQPINAGAGFYGKQDNFSVAGARPLGQALLMDNANLQDFWAHGAGSGALGTTLGVEAIAEFQTLTSVYSAQFGGNGAVVNAVSKSGANTIHGSAYEFWRNSRFDAKGYFDPQKQPFSKNQYGGSFGGPIKKDKAFFFVNYEGIHQTVGLTQEITVPDANAHNGLIPINGVLTQVNVAPAILPFLALYPLPTTLTSGGLGRIIVPANETGRENFFLGRLDYTFSPKDTLFVRYISDRAVDVDPFRNGDNALPYWGQTATTNNQFFTIEEKRLPSNTVVNSLRFSFLRPGDRGGDTNDAAFPFFNFFPGEARDNGAINIGGLTGLGSAGNSPYVYVTNKFVVGDDVYWTKGAHDIKFGVAIQKNNYNTRDAFGWGGAYNFDNLLTFLQGSPSSVTGALPHQDNSQRNFREFFVMPYFQDNWKATSRLTLNLGVRYEAGTNPSADNLTAIVDPPNGTGYVPVSNVFKSSPSLKNIDPRLGAAYDLFGTQKVSIRGGFGIFHNTISARDYALSFWGAPPYATATQLFPVFPTPFAAGTDIPPVTPTTQFGTDYRTDATSYQMQYNGTVEMEVMSHTVLTVGYLGSKGKNLWVIRDENPEVPTIAPDGTTVYGTLVGSRIVPNPRINPLFGPLMNRLPDGYSTYNSLQTALNRRFANNVQAQVSYTLSRCTDLTSGSYGGLDGGAALTNPYNPGRDLGPCDYNRTHNVRASGVVAVPFHGSGPAGAVLGGWQASVIASFTSGAPFSPLVGFNRSGLQVGRPNLVSGRTESDIILGGVQQYFDPTAFSIPAVGTQGTLGKNLYIGPNSKAVDLALLKDFAISGQARVQLRAEVFNMLNTDNFGLPNRNVFVLAPLGGATINPNAGRITTAGAPRKMQFGLRFSF